MEEIDSSGDELRSSQSAVSARRESLRFRAPFGVTVAGAEPTEAAAVAASVMS